MKALALLVISGLSGMVAAAELPAAAGSQGQPAVEQYNYSMHLDIARVVRLDEIPNVCGVVPVQMTYQDHQGELHTIEYSVMGNGCSNG